MLKFFKPFLMGLNPEIDPDTRQNFFQEFLCGFLWEFHLESLDFFRDLKRNSSNDYSKNNFKIFSKNSAGPRDFFKGIPLKVFTEFTYGIPSGVFLVIYSGFFSLEISPRITPRISQVIPLVAERGFFTDSSTEMLPKIFPTIPL